jgi:hypothetical protein
MIKLSRDDRKELLKVLEAVPLLDTRDGRVEALRDAGMADFAKKIDLSDPKNLAVRRMVSFLADYGRLASNQEALGVFLDSMKEEIGVQEQDKLDGLLIKYEMMAPKWPPAGAGEGKGREKPEDSASTAEIRKFIMDRFSDGELMNLCFDYFPDVYQEFTPGMTRSQKVRLLLDHARRRGRIPDLQVALERERPEQYRKAFPAD